MRLKDKVAVVTGASSGMGRAIALAFAKEGAKVVAVARRKEMLDELVDEAKAFGGTIVAIQGDVSQKSVNEHMIDYAVETFGSIDILVNNAGIVDQNMPVAELSDELWERVLTVNLTGPMYACRKAVQKMLEKGSGNIINIASIGGLRGGVAGTSYITSKFGLIGMTKNIGYMYAKEGIRCNAICPGGVNTEITLKGVGFENASKFGSERAMLGTANNPRSADPEEIANIAVFLASDESSFINGAAIVADGGWSAY